MTARRPRSKHSVRSLDRVKAELKEQHEALVRTRTRGGWRAVGAMHGITGAMAHAIAVKGYEPRDPNIRARLGMAAYMKVQICPTCGRLHNLVKACPTGKPENAPKPRVRWKKLYNELKASTEALVAEAVEGAAKLCEVEARDVSGFDDQPTRGASAIAIACAARIRKSSSMAFILDGTSPDGVQRWLTEAQRQEKELALVQAGEFDRLRNIVTPRPGFDRLPDDLKEDVIFNRQGQTIVEAMIAEELRQMQDNDKEKKE